MKIAFDAKRITHNTTGLGNYGRFVVNSMAHYYPDNNYLLYSPKVGKQKCVQQVSNVEKIKFLYPDLPVYSSFPLMWRTWRLSYRLKRDNVDLFHGLSNELPLGIGVPSIVTIHDLIFKHFPQYYKQIDRTIYNYKFKYACQKADRIIAVSESTKRDIASFYGIRESKIDVVYQGCHPDYSRTVSLEKKGEVASRYGLDKPFVLYVGSIEQRKNLLLAVKAIETLGNNTTLVAIGRRTAYTETVESYIKEKNLANRVKILTKVNHDDLPTLYQLASVFVYPSLFEGFGIPIIEALNSGVPVIAAIGSCLEEAGGPNSLYVDPANHLQLASYIKEVLNNAELASEMILKGKEYAQCFEPKVITSNLMDVYEKVV